MFYFVSARWHVASLADKVQSLFELLTFPSQTSALLQTLFCFLLLSHKRMQVGKQDPKIFKIATLPGTLMSLKYNQFVCLPCHLLSLAHGDWSLVLMSALQLVENILDMHMFVFFCWGLGVSPFMQIIAVFTSVAFQREGKCRILQSEAYPCLCGSGATSISGRMIFRGRRADRRGILQSVGNSSVAICLHFVLGKSKFLSWKHLCT